MKFLKNISIAGLMVLFASFAIGQGMHGQNQSRNRPNQSGMMGGQGMMAMMHGEQGMMGGGMHGGMMQGMMGMQVPSVHTILRQSTSLNLSSDQITQIQKTALAVQKDLIDLKAGLQKQHLEFKSVLLSEDLQEKNLRQSIEAQTSARAAIQKRQIQGFFEARKILTPEQRNNLVLMPMGAGMMGRGGMNQQMQQPGQRGMQNMMNNNNGN